MSGPDYVIVTAARNEQAYLERTLRSVAAQTMPPAAWVVVSDGSTDGTPALVRRYAARFPFIRLVEANPDGSRNFGSKANAINKGYDLLRALPHEFVAILDADVSFESDYYRQMLVRFEHHPRLGLAGGILYDNCNGVFVKQRTSLEWSVSGPIQMFRRACFEAIGGYRVLPRGGIDAVAESAARMKGWQVRAFPELRVMHHRRTGAEKGNLWVTCWRDGLKEYGYGCHPLFETAKAAARLLEAPPVVGSLLRLGGYFTGWLRRERRALPPDVLAAIRREQWARLTGRLGRIGFGKGAHA